MSQTQKKTILLIILYCVTVFFSVLLYWFGTLNSWQDKITDRFFTKQTPQQNIVILAIDNESISAVGQWPWPRAIFADVLSHLGTAKVVGIDINFSEGSRVGTADDARLATSLQTLSPSTPIIVPIEAEVRGRISNRPLEIFQPYVQEGFTNITVDSDGILRRAQSQSDTSLNFSVLLAQKAQSDIQVPSSFRIHYSGTEKTFLTFPIIDVIKNKVPEHVFQDAIVLIGATAQDLHDIVNTPFGSISGVEIHANTIETILNGTYLTPLSPLLTILLITLIDLISLLSIIFIKRFSVLVLTLLTLLVGINVVGFAVFSYLIIFPTLYVSLSLILITILTIGFQYISESQEKRFIRKSFQHYISKELVDELVAHPEKLVLGGERRHISILFSDIRGFTTISEAMTPEELTAFMTEYFEVISEIVLDNRGILDKYIGDAMMAYWGAPVLNPHHMIDACRVAIRMMRDIKKQNEIWQSRNLPPIHIGIGINTGDVVVGNMGSKKRFNYGIVGDEVNFTSRLEGLTKEYGISCIVSETTKKEIGGIADLVTRELDVVRVKGKKEPKKIFELITDPLTDTIKNQLELFEKGRILYHRGAWDEAITVFSEVQALGPDGPSNTLSARCEVYKKDPPQQWTGIHDFKTK